MRLIELTVVACHQIGAYLFSLEPGNHSKQLHEDWAMRVRNKSPEERLDDLYIDIPPCAFFHSVFQDHERYPRGKADVAGYWAEARIFGGVVVFDRGETDMEVRFETPMLPSSRPELQIGSRRPLTYISSVN